MQPDEKIKLYRSLFRGRDDIYAKRWEKAGRAGYAQAYSFSWDEFDAYRAQGGTMKTFENKQPIALSDEIIRQHLLGQLVIGIYPILLGNSSYFLAADFDHGDWLNDCKEYQQAMAKLGLPTYIERSRSGDGGHVWLFFSDPYPCYKSRVIGLEVARRVLHLSRFDKEVSFDRLFPNQDTISENGFGNLIALPFQGESVRMGNTVFIDPVDGEPYDDQHSILLSVKRSTTLALDIAYNNVVNESNMTPAVRGKKLHVSVSQHIILQKSQLSNELVVFLKEQLNFLNTEYLTKKRFGASLYEVQKYFRLIDEAAVTIALPRGFLARLLKFLYENNIKYEVSFVTSRLADCKFKSSITLTDVQESIVRQAVTQKQGIIVAPPGGGKTMMGMELVSRHQKPALILVHRKELLDQWVDRVQTYLTISKAHIGRFSSAKKTTGKEITVGLLQSFARMNDFSDLRDKFGTIIVDECHHIPAKTFRNVIAQLNPEFLYGLTATPKRKHNDEQLIYVYIGDIIADMSDFIDSKVQMSSKQFDIIFRETNLQAPFNWQTDSFDLIAKIISYDTSRNGLVTEDILKQVHLGRRTLVLSERKDHLKVLELYLKGRCEVIILTGMIQ